MEGALSQGVKGCLTFALLVASGVLPLRGATLERLSMDDLIVKSTAIVRGTVSSTWTAYRGRDIYTHYKIQVSESFKGPAQQVVEIMVPGGVIGALHQTVAGSPTLAPGDSYVFFLWTSNQGVTWIMGLTQGLFRLSGSDAVDPTATRAASGELMLDPATARPVKDAALSMKLSALRTRIAGRLKAGGVQ
ncbi:MAG: hypothetical protein JST11_16755 [Acidobacteria bacterium]|nr:hypothetical protein [Acidobacteriota bacterium]